MRFFSLPGNSRTGNEASSVLFLVALVISLVHSAAAIRSIGSNSLATCMDNSGISATTFDILFTPDNSSLAFNINGVSTISGDVKGMCPLVASY
jgi:hypothetical protein